MSRVLRPLFVNVTWGAGGCTASKSLELAEICQKQIGLTTCLHLTCTNMRREVIDEALEAAKAMGIRNILALRGDPPREHEYGLLDARNKDGGGGLAEGKDSNDDFTWAIDLVRYIRRNYGDYFCIGVAAYPEGYADESYPTHQSPEHDLPYLLEKVQAGADFIMTQLFYDLDAYLRFEKLLREHESGVFASIPIIPGLMPIQSFEMLKRITKLSNAKLPAELLKRLEGVAGDDEAVKSVGVDAISEIVEGIQKAELKSPQGFHFYNLNLEKAVGYIVERCKLISLDTDDEHEQAIDDTPTDDNITTASQAPGIEIHQIPFHRRVSSSATAQSQLTTSLENDNLSSTSALGPTLATTHGIGPLAREATWDDYTNGRFGDARSPAFYPPLSYSSPTLPVSPSQALALWGTPTTINQITHLFTAHLSGHTPAQLPWSESSTLSPETVLVLPQLLHLNSRGWWTIASQPSVDGVPSSDPIHGWGPKGGFVFQKAFVEFFLPLTEWNANLRPYLESPAVRDSVSWYAGDFKGNFYQSGQPHNSDTNGDGDGAGGGDGGIGSDQNDQNDEKTTTTAAATTTAQVHAVTWGMFPGKEIATATMVEAVSFRTWAEEAFGLWAEWARVVGEAAGLEVVDAEPEAEARERGSQGRINREQSQKSKHFLKTCAESSILVNVIGHEFRDRDRDRESEGEGEGEGDSLWDLLMKAAGDSTGADGDVKNV